MADKKRSRILVPIVGGALVLVSVFVAVLSSGEAGVTKELAAARSLIEAGRLDEAYALLFDLDTERARDVAERSRLLARIDALKKARNAAMSEEIALQRAREARDRGDWDAAALALSAAGDRDPELAREVAEELAKQAERKAAEWETEEAQRLVDLARKALTGVPEVDAAEMVSKEAERRKRKLADLLARAAAAEAEGDLALAAKLYRQAARMDGPRDLVYEAEEKSGEVGQRVKEAEDRAEVMAQIQKLLDEGKVREARQLLDRYEKKTGDDSLSAYANALHELEKQGGTKSYLPVRRALRWLAAHQDPDDGGFRGQKFTAVCKQAACAGAGRPDYDIGVTGLSLMAFTAFTELDVLKEFAEPANRATKFLIGKVGKDGRVNEAKGIAGGYTESIVALALLERAGTMENAAAETETARRIITYLLDVAQLDDGGWRYQPKSRMSDVSVTCWALQALHAARGAGIPVPDDNLYRALDYLGYLTDASGRSSYTVGTSRHLTMTPAALLAKQLFGANREDRLIEASIRYTSYTRPGRFLRTRGKRTGRNLATDALGLYNKGGSFYLWYYQTYALRLAGGNQWKIHGPAVEKLLVATQETHGHSLGSWDPVLAWSRNAGRIYATAMATLTLEVYYRSKAGLSLAPKKGGKKTGSKLAVR